jgi:hypothetical protein
MNRLLFASLLLSGVPFITLACSEDTSVTPVISDADASATAPSASSSPSDAAPPPVQDATLDAVADTGKPACNDLQNIAAEVREMREATDPPVATGGTLDDGTYVLVRMTEHTGLGGATGFTGQTRSMTIRKASDRYDSVFEGVARSAEVSFRGAEMTATTVCPGTGVTTTGYTATPTTFTVRFPGGPSTRVYTFEKR